MRPWEAASEENEDNGLSNKDSKDGSNKMNHSRTAMRFLGERIPTNTLNNTGTGIKAFA